MFAASNFGIYFQLGMEHILDLDAYDHLCFVIALGALYLLEDWRKVLILVTAFTIGHSITLALATFELVSVNMDVVEFFIPTTIFITTVSNLFKRASSISARKIQTNYLFALFFGLIHGLGFSNFLRASLTKTERFAESLLAFNLGLELGQVIIVGVALLIGTILVGVFGVNKRDWTLVISAAIAGIALILMKETWLW